MNNKTVTSTLAMLLSVASVGAQHARAQEPDTTTTSQGEPPADGQPPSADAPAPDQSAGPPADDGSAPPADEANPYETGSESVAVEGESTETVTAPPPKGAALRWGAQVGYMLPTDPQPPFRAAKWMPIGLELGVGTAKSPFAFVTKIDGSPVCFGGEDCSGLQFRALAGLEVGIQKATDSVLHMVYLNASLGYRYVSSEITNEAGSSAGSKIDGESILISEVSASMMIPVTHNFSIGPRAAVTSNLTSDTPEGVSMVELGIRILHAPGR